MKIHERSAILTEVIPFPLSPRDEERNEAPSETIKRDSRAVLLDCAKLSRSPLVFVRRHMPRDGIKRVTGYNLVYGNTQLPCR